MEIQNKNSNMGKITGGVIGLATTPLVFQQAAKKAKLNGNIVQNLDTFINSKGNSVKGALEGIIEEATGEVAKPSFLQNIGKTKSGRIGVLIALAGALTFAGVCFGRTVDKLINKSKNDKIN